MVYATDELYGGRNLFEEAPVLPVAVFMLAILDAVAFAYYLGWRRVRKINLVEALRDDTMF